MKALFIAILLAVLALQGAATVLGFDAGPAAQSVHACSDNAPDCDSAASSDERQVSTFTEELSDYLPPGFSLTRVHCGSALQAVPAPAVASIDLPMRKPPPRA